jgi:ATP-dependent exoDNAse (exonuclease V) alpha subunit
MLSLAKVTPQMGSHYFSKEDYYSQEQGPAKPEFFGKGTSLLGIKINFNQITFQSLKEGRAQFPAISPEFDCEGLTDLKGFTKGQGEAFRLSMTNKDFLFAWVGVAGSGKSYALKDVKKVSQDQGYEVIGLAPDGNTVKELAKSTEMKTLTLDKFLLQKRSKCFKKKLWIVDEAGKISTNKMALLIDKAQEEKARILLVGDTRQIGAVEAGSPFKLLLKNNILNVELLEHRRQTNKKLKEAVEMASRDQLIEKSVYALENNSFVYKTRKSRIKNIVNQYTSLSANELKSTLVITDNNKDRLDLVSEIRKELKKVGKIGKHSHSATILRPKDLSEAQKKYHWSYQLGDVIVPFKDIENTALKKDYQYTVEKINKKTGQVTLRNRDFYTTISPMKVSKFSIYREDKLDISGGDILNWTKNNNGKINREQVSVKKIENNLIYLNETKEPINLQSKHYLDHAIVQTTYGSQGQTADNIIFMAESNVSSETWYVAISRAKNKAIIVTDNLDKLSKRVLLKQQKFNALDFDVDTLNKKKDITKVDNSFEVSL